MMSKALKKTIDVKTLFLSQVENYRKLKIYNSGFSKGTESLVKL